MNIVGLFPTPVARISSFLNDHQCEYFKHYCTDAEYHLDKGPSKMSLNTTVLDVFPDVKSRIEDTFTEFAYNTLGVVKTCNFKITTSWATSTPPQASSSKHKHSNSYWSGVLYFDDDVSPLVLYRPEQPSAFLVDAQEINDFCTQQVAVTPSKGDIVFFPSYLEHRVSSNTSPHVRHSLAFNMLPNGIIGQYDSQCSLTIN